MSFDPVRLAGASGLIGTAATRGATTYDGVTSLKASSDISDIYGLGKDDFFKLFLAQLQNQDPTKPMDDKEMLAQLAQFSLIDTMQQVSKALGGTQLAQASSLIGKQVIGTDTSGLPASGIVDRIVQDQHGIMLVLEGGALVEPADVTQVLEPAGARADGSSTSTP